MLKIIFLLSVICKMKAVPWKRLEDLGPTDLYFKIMYKVELVDFLP